MGATNYTPVFMLCTLMWIVLFKGTLGAGARPFSSCDSSALERIVLGGVFIANFVVDHRLWLTYFLVLVEVRQEPGPALVRFR